MKLFTKISRLHTFGGFALKNGRHGMPEDFATIDDACMLISSRGEILWTGSAPQWHEWALSKTPTWRNRIKKISLNGCEVLPAFVECHTHLLYLGSRAGEFERRNRGESYLSIGSSGGGIRLTVQTTARASEHELETAIVDRLQSLVRQGVTTVEVKTGYAGTIAEERRHLALLVKLQQKKSNRNPRLVITCLAAHSIPDGETEESWLKKVEGLLPFVKKIGARLDIFIEQGAFSLRGGESLLTQAIAKGIPVVVHADQLTRSGGTALGVRLKASSVEHVIEVGKEEITALAKSQTVAVLLPAADLYSRLAYPRAREMIDAGVRVGLATDHNPGSSPALDVALVGVLARTMMQMTLPEVYAAYTTNAAVALGLGERLGVLSEGRSADFLVLKPKRGLDDLFYEIGPDRSHSAIAQVWRSGTRID